MKKSSTLFLKIAVIFIGIPVLALCLFLLPQIANEANEALKKGSDVAFVVYGILMVMYGIGGPFLLRFIPIFYPFKLYRQEPSLLGIICHSSKEN
jgi:hypothetical protein